MRKKIIPRILLLSLLYILIFIIIVAIQFPVKNRTDDGVIEDTSFNPRDFTIQQFQNSRDFIAAVSRWQDGNFIAWNRLISQQNDEDLVLAFAEESLNRSSYGAALTAIPAAFRNGNRRTYLSSVFLGQLSQTYRSLVTADQEMLNLLNKQLQEKSPDFLLEPDIFDFMVSRGLASQFNQAISLVKSMAPESVTLELCPAIFRWDMEFSDSDIENPFSHLIESAFQAVSESVRMNSDRNKVFAVSGESIDTVFNLRLGKELLGWAEIRKNDPWIALARSIIVSVLTLENYTGYIRAEYGITAEGEIREIPSSTANSTAKYYRILGLGEYSPRAVVLSSGDSHIWAWTAGRIGFSNANNIMDISVNFPVNETHYMIIRGVKPFTKIQLYNMDYRSDPQFERYDSSGWSYIAAEQILLVKMKHKAEDEHIRIFY